MMNRLRDLKTKQDELRECLTSVITDGKSRLEYVSTQSMSWTSQPGIPDRQYTGIGIS